MDNDPKSYDLVVIGGGPAGINGATTARLLGKTVALVDRHHQLGGAGPIPGTVPSKTLRETAVRCRASRSRDLLRRAPVAPSGGDLGDFLRHERQVKTGLNAFFAQQLETYQAKVYYGDASFLDPHTLSVRTIARSEARDEHKEQAATTDGHLILKGEKILIATGSTPVRPSLFPFGPGVYDSDTILELENLPADHGRRGRRGQSGSEYACIFAAREPRSTSSMAAIYSCRFSIARSLRAPFLDGTERHRFSLEGRRRAMRRGGTGHTGEAR